MVFRISRRFRFAAAHSLPSLPDGHKCKRPHGHTYDVDLVLWAEVLDEHGFVLDYGDLGEFRDLIEQDLDHRDLNEVLPMATTVENIASWLFRAAEEMGYPVDRVRVSENPGETWGEYEP